ncbi:MAG: hypothetical protein ACOY3P_25555 [Planctomycetota bacterium]
MSDALLPSRFLFRLSVPCRQVQKLWTAQGAKLDETHRLPNFGELEGRAAWAEVRAGWNEEGLVFSVRVRGKKQPAWCRASRPEDSDGVQFWIDTRDVHNVHRASRFCHRFLFMPSGGGKKVDVPHAAILPINRAREQPRPVADGALQVRATITADGYTLDALLPAAALTGFDPAEYPRLGFHYAVIDRELGEQTFGPGSPLPYDEDPSLWATLELVRG